MYLQDYLWFMMAIIVCLIFSGIASAKVKSAFVKHDKTSTHSGFSGYDTVIRLMRSHHINNIAVGKVQGTLSDHYHPAKQIVNLSESTYGNRSIAAVAVAAHEMGHVMQKKDGYLFYNIRTALVPVVNFGSRMAFPLILVGILIDGFTAVANSNPGFYIAILGVILYSASFLFALFTLPVELNASSRAKKMLLEEGILTQDEMAGAGEVLSAAAMTYLASLLTSLVYLLRFLFYVLTIFGRRNNR